MSLGLFVSFFLLFSFGSSAQTPSYRFDVKSGQCISSDPSLSSRKSLKALDFPNIDKDKLKNIPVCARAETCLDADRVQRLFLAHAIPRGIESGSFLSGPFKAKAERTCSEDKAPSPLRGFGELVSAASEKNKIYPAETKIAYDVVKNTKENVDSFLSDSQFAMAAIKNCLELDVEYSSVASSSEEKLKIYQERSKQNPKQQKFCERIWQPDSEIVQIRHELKRMRQALLGLQLIKSGAAKNAGSLYDLAEKMKANAPLPEKARAVLSKNLSPKKGGIFGAMQSSFWNGTPDSLEPPNNHEQSTLQDYLVDLMARYPGAKLEAALQEDYVQAISETPILAHYSSARPTSAENLKAFKSYQAESFKASKLKIDDMDYLAFSTALNEAIKAEKPEVQGDACVLMAALMKSRNDHYSTPSDLLTGLMLMEAGGAVGAAKGLFKKLTAVFDAGYAGSLSMVTSYSNALQVYNLQKKTCALTMQNSNGLCNVGTLDKASMEVNVALGLALAYGPKTRALLAVPALSRDSAKD